MQTEGGTAQSGAESAGPGNMPLILLRHSAFAYTRSRSGTVR